MTFSEFVGHEDAKLAMVLNAIDPQCGGVLFVGEKGTGKSTLSRLMKNLLPERTPFVELPLNITDDALIGGVHIEATLKTGKRIFQAGLLGRADQGVIYIDDVNLLSPEIVALVLEAQEKGENVVEREGLSIRQASRFILMASMNPEEAILSSHLLDRFGMCVLWESLKDCSQKIGVIKMAMAENSSKSPSKNSDDVKGKIQSARQRLKHIVVPSEIEEYISQACLGNNISGHRGDLFLFHGARAYAAFVEEEKLTKEHVDEIIPLVLTHRRRIFELMEDEQEEPRVSNEKDREPKDHPEKLNQRPTEKTSSSATSQDGSINGDFQLRESSLREEVFEVGKPFPVRRMVFGKDRLTRLVSGRRTKTKSKGKGGRYVKSIFRAGEDDFAIDATIRAAAPFQRVRGRQGILVIKREDFRFKQKERKMGHLVIFVVDGSGSMGAQRRMVETKGAIQSLLMDCYQKRDRVSMIVFQKNQAEIVLPPTSSVELAARRLRNIPVGGKTPLSAGLLRAYQLIKQVRFREPQTRFLLVLITDGRANQSMASLPVGEELKNTTALLRKLRFTEYVVVDTEDKKSFIKTDFALQISSGLGADYYTIKDLRSEVLTDIVQLKKIKVQGMSA